MNRRTGSVIDGLLAGGLATLGMSILPLAANRLGMAMGEFPPRKIVRKTLFSKEAQVRKPGTVDAATAIAHFAFGMGNGVVFAAVRSEAPLKSQPVIQGMLFGLALWSASYQGWIPALKLMPPADKDQPGRAVSILGAHLVYGAVLGSSALFLDRCLAERPSHVDHASHFTKPAKF